MLLPTGCCYQLGVVTNRVFLPTGCSYQLGVVTIRVLLKTGCCYQPGVGNNQLGVVNKGGDKGVGETTFDTLAPKGGVLS